MRCFLPSDSAWYVVLWTSDTSQSNILGGSWTSAAHSYWDWCHSHQLQGKQSLLVHVEFPGSLACHCSSIVPGLGGCADTTTKLSPNRIWILKLGRLLGHVWRHTTLRVLRNILGRLGSRKGCCFICEVGAIPMKRCLSHFRRKRIEAKSSEPRHSGNEDGFLRHMIKVTEIATIGTTLWKEPFTSSLPQTSLWKNGNNNIAI